MEMTEKMIREDIETAIRIRDNNCKTWAEKDALANLINFVEKTLEFIKVK